AVNATMLALMATSPMVFERFMDRSTNSHWVYIATARRQLRIQILCSSLFLDVDHHAVLSDGDAPNGPQVGTCAIWERFEVEFTDESW
ncbi:MAG: hypothetical protein VX340_14165, partial [Pseudomonadota bacterium]|nr:hypothetical protein [Pseudomonadota bacterium]